ncbi:MAG: phosphotransferase [Chloroflexi bacterium]|nr:phosphotransferase [Chloroflexota bacterium]
MEEQRPKREVWSEPDFVRRYALEALATLGGEVRAQDITLRMYEGDVAEYRSGEVAVVAKVYSDRARSDHTWAVLRTLTAEGFGVGSPYRIPRPLLRTPDGSVIFMEAARDAPLSPGDAAAFVTGCRRAGEWLAHLHARAARVGAPTGSSEVLADVHEQLAVAEERGVVVAAYRDLQERIEHALARTDRMERVQTHGRFHPGHAFIGPEAITLIDFDRSCPRDPAVDVATFLYRLHTLRLKGKIDAGGVLADAEAALLQGYGRTPAHLDAYLAAAWFGAVLRTLGKRRADPQEREHRLRYSEAQLHRSGAATI